MILARRILKMGGPGMDGKAVSMILTRRILKIGGPAGAVKGRCSIYQKGLWK